MTTSVKSFLKQLPLTKSIQEMRASRVRAAGAYPPGHFYSPIISTDEIVKDRSRVFARPTRSVPGLDLNEDFQSAKLRDFFEYYKSVPFEKHKTGGKRYFYENPAYSYSDAIILNCVMRDVKPNRVIEIGSGYSSCAMLDTAEFNLEKPVEFSFIEPYPELLLKLLHPGDIPKINLLAQRAQDVPLEIFSQLEANDILFIDSTHVSKTGSDVNRVFFEILPHLASGVYIHIHDIFFPFEYPENWVMEGRSWNEIYMLRAFLQYNDHFSIFFMNTFMENYHESVFREHMPLCLENTGGSIWLRKL